MSNITKIALLSFGLSIFMNHVLRILGDTASQSFIYASIPSILISISLGMGEEKPR